MTTFYYGVALLNAAVCFTAAVAVWRRNRHQEAGPYVVSAVVAFAVWLTAYAQYYVAMPDDLALLWAKITLSASIINQPLILHALLAYVGRAKRHRYSLLGAYLLGVVFLALLWNGNLITGLRSAAYMHHYARYDQNVYPFLGLYYVSVIVLGLGAMIRSSWEVVGYQRMQRLYFTAAWGVVIGATYFVVMPIEYGISIPPIGFFVLPFNLAFLAYVMAKARLADFNVVIARVFLFTVTLMTIALIALVFIGGMALVSPGFLNEEQIFFTLCVVLTTSTVLTIALPRLLPRAERLMQERLIEARAGYQGRLGGLAKELNRIPLIDEVLSSVADILHTEMQLSRVLIFLQNPLSGRFSLQAQCGLTAEQAAVVEDIRDESEVLRWLTSNRDTLVVDELARREDPEVAQALRGEMAAIQAAACVPMILDEKLVGFIALSEKVNQQMFYVTDIRLLENLATEVALALKYRRMEDAIFRKNRLIELGTIAAGVAHEIRNPLASIRTFAQLLPHKMDDPEFTNDFSKLVLNDVDRITKVIESMLAFARPAQVTIAAHGAVDLADEAIVLVQSRLKSKRIELSRQYHDRPEVRVDKNQIMQVLVNLLNNAVEALPNDGKIRVAVGVQQLDMPDDPELRGRYATIEVSDNGAGIPAAVRSRLFDPFFTTKKEGTGLGLSISQKIVRDHGGFISVTSVEGKGTSFQVNLPLN